MRNRSVLALLAVALIAAGHGAQAQDIRATPGSLWPKAERIPIRKRRRPKRRPMTTRKTCRPEEMRRRFPQPVRVGDLIGLPLLDWDDSTIGYVRHVVRTPEGKIQLIVNQGRLFGWGGRLVQVPIEAVAILARQADRPARHTGGRISRRSCLVRGHHPANSIRRHDQDRRLAPLISMRSWRMASRSAAGCSHRMRAINRRRYLAGISECYADKGIGPSRTRYLWLNSKFGNAGAWGGMIIFAGQWSAGVRSRMHSCCAYAPSRSYSARCLASFAVRRPHHIKQTSSHAR